jgi:hypothetical protein
MLTMDKELLTLMNAIQPTAEMRARTYARICTGPAFNVKDGKLVFSREATQRAYDNMYNTFLKAHTKENA